MDQAWLGAVVLALSLGACGGQDPPPPNPNVLTLELGGERPSLRGVLEAVARRRLAEPAPAVAPLQPLRLPPPPRYAELGEGETLSQLAARELGSSRRWREIAELNGISDPTVLSAGMRLRLPPE